MEQLEQELEHHERETFGQQEDLEDESKMQLGQEQELKTSENQP